MGLPDVEKANAVYVDAFAKAMKGAGNVEQLQEYAKQLAPMGQMGLKMFQNFMEGARKAGERPASKATERPTPEAPVARWTRSSRCRAARRRRRSRSSGSAGRRAGAALRALAGRFRRRAARSRAACAMRPANCSTGAGAVVPGPEHRDRRGPRRTAPPRRPRGGRGGRGARWRRMPGLRRAEPGEFTRRAFANGRIDLAEAEGLADLLAAETELQRRAAMAMAGGALSRQVEGWRERLLGAVGAARGGARFRRRGRCRRRCPATFAREIDGLGRRDRRLACARPRRETAARGLPGRARGPAQRRKIHSFQCVG